MEDCASAKYPITAVRRKVGTYNAHATKWYRCYCKYGTHGLQIMLLRDYPKEHILTVGVEDSIHPKRAIWGQVESFWITEVRESDNFVFLEKM